MNGWNRWTNWLHRGVALSCNVGVVAGVVCGLVPAIAQPVADAPSLEGVPENSEPENPEDNSLREGSPYIRPQTACPSDLDELIPLLLRDVPSYANRVSQRAYDTIPTDNDIPGHILLASLPDYEPIVLTPQAYTPLEANDTSQIFFTTLERQYALGEVVSLQTHHWVFLTETSNGWRLVFMFSAIGDVPQDEPPTPPYDSSQGVIAQAIRLWLRDCQTRSVYPARSHPVLDEVGGDELEPELEPEERQDESPGEFQIEELQEPPIEALPIEALEE